MGRRARGDFDGVEVFVLFAGGRAAMVGSACWLCWVNEDRDGGGNDNHVGVESLAEVIVLW